MQTEMKTDNAIRITLSFTVLKDDIFS